MPVAVIIGLMAMKLQQTQRDILEDLPYPGWRGIDKQPNHRYEGSDGSRYPPGLLQRHMARTPSKKTRPMASAPYSMALRASSARVIPQILTRVRMIRL